MRTNTATALGQDGFTLIELLVTIAVAALVLGLAAPTFRELAVRNQLANSSNEIISSVMYARSEAVRRGRPVSICKSNNGTGCGGNWSDGWIIFVNLDDDSPAAVDAGEAILRTHEALPSTYTLNADASLDGGITYGTDGAANTVGLMAVCHNSELVGSRAVVLTRLRPRMAKDSDGDKIPNRDDGANIAGCTTPGA